MKIFGYTLKSFIPGIVAVIAVGAVGGAAAFAVVFSGALNLSATYPDPKWMYHVIHNTFKNSVAWRAAEDIPDDLHTESRVLLGAQHYANACAKCHGGPGMGQNPQALAMRPRPQHLQAVVDQFTDGELHWILEGGVRMSAMPAWPTNDRRDEIWNTVAFIRQLPDMTAEEYVALLQPRDIAQPEAAAAIEYDQPGPLVDNGLDLGRGEERWPEEEYAYSSPATEWRDFAIEGDLVQRCAACHGAEGAGSATLGRAPNLTVLSSDYITNALVEYASGERKSGIMQIVASNLSTQQRVALGQYFAALENAPSMMTGGDGDMARGELIATQGKIEAAVPACVTCHNNGRTEGMRAAGMEVPNLAGQSAAYISEQLHLFKAGIRQGGAEWKPMGYIAENLTDEEIEAMAAYWSSQPVAVEVAMNHQIASADLADGERVVDMVCKECHTVTGQGSDEGDIPNLSLQTGEYIHQQLWKFRADIRPNSQMVQTARQISAEELTNVAAYLGAIEVTPVTRETDQEAVARGFEIANYGIEDANVPSCLTCHAETEVNQIRMLPRLHGQNFKYLESRLDQFAGDTGDDLYALSPMHRIATRMTEQQRADVAAWFAAQEPLGKMAQATAEEAEALSPPDEVPPAASGGVPAGGQPETDPDVPANDSN